MVTRDYKYEVGGSTDVTTVAFTCLIRAMEGIDESDIAGEPSDGDPTYQFHVTVQKNEKEYGIHPRHVLLARTITGSGGNSCLVQKGTIFKKLPILTISRFSDITEWESDDATNAPDSAKITLAHKPDGSGNVDYIVVQKVFERHV